MTHPLREYELLMTRRQLLGRATAGIGVAALASLLNPGLLRGATELPGGGGLSNMPSFAPKAKRVIYMVMSGGPSHIDLLDPKPLLEKHRARDLRQVAKENGFELDR